MTERPCILYCSNLREDYDFAGPIQECIQIELNIILANLLELAQMARLLLGQHSSLALDNQEVICFQNLHEEVVHTIPHDDRSDYDYGELTLRVLGEEQV